MFHTGSPPDCDSHLPLDDSWFPRALRIPHTQQQQQRQREGGEDGNGAQQHGVGNMRCAAYEQWAAMTAEVLSGRVPGRDGGKPCRRAEKGFYAFDSSGTCTKEDMRQWCLRRFESAVSYNLRQHDVEAVLEAAKEIPAYATGDGSFQRNVPPTFKSLLSALEQFGVLPLDYGTIDYEMCTHCGFIYRQVFHHIKCL